MPYEVSKQGNKYCVVKKDTREVMKCYDNVAEANKYNTALNMAHARSKGYIQSEEPLSEDVKEELREWDPDT